MGWHSTKHGKLAKLGIATLLLVIGFSLLLTGCGAKKVASVNGEAIKTADFDRRVEETKNYYTSQMNVQFDGEKGEEMMKTLKEMVLDQMVTERLLLQEAKKRGIAVTTEQIEKQVEQDKAMVGGEQAYQAALKEQLNMTEAEYRQEMEKQMTMEALYQQVVAGQEVTPQEVADYFQNNQTQFMTLEQIRVAHILLNTEEEAKAVITQLKGGAKLEDLAVSKSIDPSAKENKGDLGYFDQEASLVPEFKEAAFALKPGQMTQTPVKTQYGYHVIKMIERKPARQQTLEESTSSITEQLRRSKQSNFFQQFVENLEAGATIEKEAVTAQTGAVDSTGKQ